MDIQKLFEILFVVIGGLGVFLLGMKFMSEGMQAVAGEKLRKLIGAVTNNRFLACGVGTAVTSVIQSSSVTTVMVVGMVNAGIMTLKQAIGVIFGANIGTTITGWILTVKIDKYGLPLLGVAALFYLFSRRDRIRFTAMFFLGLGMVFFGLELMKNGFSPVKDMPQFVEWFHRFEPVNYLGVMKCVLAGAILTAIVQSSSATLGITMALAFSGIINFKTGAALVLGENIGTTITAFLASLGTTTNARRAAYAHMLFNILGVLWITTIFQPYSQGIAWFIENFQHGHLPDEAVYVNNAVTYPYTQAAIAATHTGFNILNTLFFLPFVGLLARLLMFIVPDKAVPETPRLTYLDMRLFDTPSIALEQSWKEVLRMGQICRTMMDTLRHILDADQIDSEKADFIFQKENDMDMVQKEIVEFLGEVMAGNISHEAVEESRRQVRMADEFESISDYVTAILKLRMKIRDGQLHITPEGKQDILVLHDMTARYIDLINKTANTDEVQPEFFSEAKTKGTAITVTMKECRGRHLVRVGDGIASPLKSLIFTDMLTSYRRIKDHAFNIAEVLAGEK
ncbi:MAG TPA: Na/Pi cotransporter family protein [Anaerohalosphaeraceae bacterium]|nr:Na/Pi cotransporter family protein [Anaerohalosphaeraceae bacterium]